MPELVFLGLGSNRGNRFSQLTKAVKKLTSSADLDFIAVSSVYETEPWGFTKQKNFLNCVLVCLWKKNPTELLRFIKKSEGELGRTKCEKWKEREIDIDVLFFGNKIIRKKDFIVPHENLHRRNFVLKPLFEIAPELIHPVFKKPISYLYKHSKDSCDVKFYKSNLIKH